MSSQAQLENLQQRIEGVARKVSDLEASLLVAEQAGIEGKFSFLRTQRELELQLQLQLGKTETLLLKAQQEGEHYVTEIVHPCI